MALIRRAGFNAIMADGAALPDEALTIADRLGLLVIGDIPLGAPDATGAELPDISATVERLGGHTSLVAWSMASGGGTDRALAMLHALDPARPVLLRSGVNSKIIVGAHAAGTFEDIDTTLTLPVPAAWASTLHRWETSNKPVLISGFGIAPAAGNAAAASAPTTPSLPNDALTGATDDPLAERGVEERALSEIRGVVESMRYAKNALGFFVRPLRGGSLSGLNTRNGIPTSAFTDAVEYNEPDMIVLRAAPAEAAGARVRLEAAIINDLHQVGHYHLYQVLTSPDGKTSITEHNLTLDGRRVQDISTLAAIAASGAGDYRLQLLLADDVTGVIAASRVMMLPG